MPSQRTELLWQRLVELEPRLLKLLEDAKNADTGSAFCTSAAWYGAHGFDGFKPRLEKLVGWYREGVLETEEQEFLYSNRAYDAAYVVILNALPPCRKCSGHQTDEYLRLRAMGEAEDWV